MDAVSIKNVRPKNSDDALTRTDRAIGNAAMMIRDEPTSSGERLNNNDVRTTNSAAGRKTSVGRATGKTTSVASGNVAMKRPVATTPTTITTSVGGATIATGTAGQIEIATNGDGGKRTHGVNDRRTFVVVKMIASDNGKFAISIFAKCAG
jgi:hypothetical protein